MSVSIAWQLEIPDAGHQKFFFGFSEMSRIALQFALVACD
jgi:hypothetical protein